ncbi:MAG: hypothetical protein WD768_05405 [Phycisphaeraceae bacterium]
MRTVIAYSVAIYGALLFAGAMGVPDGAVSDNEGGIREAGSVHPIAMPCPKRWTREHADDRRTRDLKRLDKAE